MSHASLSLILPVRNAAHLLPGCVASIRRMDYPAERLELLVVDNGSRDDSVEVAKGLGATVLTEMRPGPYAARNLGASVAQADILAFTDADCILDPGWATAVEAAMAQFDAVCGLSLGAAGGPVARLIQQRYEDNLRGRARAHPPRPVFDTRNAAVTRAVFHKAGGFDARLDDFSDDLFGIAVVQAGGRLALREDMVVTHIHPETLDGVWKRQVRHGRNIPRVLALYPPQVTHYFPGITRHHWLYDTSVGRRTGRSAVASATSLAGAALSVALRLMFRVRSEHLSRSLFELFNRVGTVHGIASASPLS